jgi:dimethylhistidine N-methyltransferase
MKPLLRISPASAATGDMLEVVQDGLRRRPKRLPSKYFYDQRGSELFERICELPEYYLTRAELELMRVHSGEIAAALGPEVLLVEYGSGCGTKTQLLLRQLERPVGYLPIELSRHALNSAVTTLRRAMPSLPITPLCADFTQPLAALPLLARGHRTVIYFPGSTIGNFDTHESIRLLRRMRQQIGADGAALIGVDLKKDPAVIEAAYNDAAGVTAQFTLNMLVRLNREIEADFNLAAFRHQAIYNRMAGRIETSIVSLRDQEVHAGMVTAHFAQNEPMLVEYSCKYAPEEFAQLAARAGLRVQQWWTDSSQRFSVYYLVPAYGSSRGRADEPEP